MSREFKCGAGDTARALIIKSNPPIDFSTATSVTFSLYDLDTVGTPPVFQDVPAAVAIGTYLIDGKSVTLTAADGALIFQWRSSADTPLGNKGGRFKATFPGSKPLSIPGDGLIPCIFT